MPVTAHPMSTRRKPPRKAPLPRKFLRFVKNCRVALGPMVNATPLRNNTWAEGSTPRVSGEERRVKAGSESERKWARTLPMASIAESNRNSTPSSRKSTPTAVSPMPISATFCENMRSLDTSHTLPFQASSRSAARYARTHALLLSSRIIMAACGVRARARGVRTQTGAVGAVEVSGAWRNAAGPKGGARRRGEREHSSAAAQQRSSAPGQPGAPQGALFNKQAFVHYGSATLRQAHTRASDGRVVVLHTHV